MVSTKVRSPSRLAHVVLRTSPETYKSMVDFYKTFLGAHASYENEIMSFLTYDEEHHRLAIATVPGTKPKDRESCGLEHIAFTFDNLSDLLEAYTQRKELGIKPLWCVNHGPTTSIYYRDPNGNQIETQVENFVNAEEATAFMQTPEFEENPYGVDFVPEDVIEKLKQGVPEKEILKRGNVGSRDISEIMQIIA